MKYRFALLAMLAMSAAPLAAQGGGAGGGMAGGMGGRQGGGGRGGMSIGTANYDVLNTWFAFSAEQKTKVEEAIKTRDAVVTPMNAYRQGLMAAAQATAGGGGGGRGGFVQLPADSQAKLTKAQTDFEASLKSILAGPQVVKFDSITAAAAARRGGGGQRGGGGGF